MNAFVGLCSWLDLREKIFPLFLLRSLLAGDLSLRIWSLRSPREIFLRGTKSVPSPKLPTSLSKSPPLTERGDAPLIRLWAATFCPDGKYTLQRHLVSLWSATRLCPQVDLLMSPYEIERLCMISSFLVCFLFSSGEVPPFEKLPGTLK